MGAAKRTNPIWLLLAIVLIFFNPLASTAANYNQESFVSATAVYSSYRVINRVMSVAADTHVQVGLVGTSAGMKPGQILRSLLDTLDRFADMLFSLMLIAGVLSVIIVPIASVGAGLAAVGITIRIVVDQVWQSPSNLSERIRRFANACAGIGFLAALLVPAAYTTGYFIGDKITARTWQEAVETFKEFAAEVEDADDTLRSAEALVEQFDIIDDQEQPSDSVVENEGISIGRLFGGVASQAGDALEATREAVSSAFAGTLSQARDLGQSSLQAFRSVPGYLDKSADLVAAGFHFLIALLVKTIVIPLIVVALFVWLWRPFLNQFATVVPEHRDPKTDSTER